jgi:hypothetical protein
MSSDYVQLPPDSTGKKVDCAEIDGVERQVVAFGDPSTRAAMVAVRDALPGSSEYGLVTREAPANVDTGIVPGTGSLVAINGEAIDDTETVYLEGLAIECHAGDAVNVTVTNGADQAIVPTMMFYGPQFLVQPMYGRPVTGLKVNAPSSVTVQAWGRK